MPDLQSTDELFQGALRNNPVAHAVLNLARKENLDRETTLKMIIVALDEVITNLTETLESQIASRPTIIQLYDPPD